MWLFTHTATLLPYTHNTGVPPCAFAPNQPVPYTRLVNHVQRLYDYDSWVEEQLEIWLAKHLR